MYVIFDETQCTLNVHSVKRSLSIFSYNVHIQVRGVRLDESLYAQLTGSKHKEERKPFI